MPGMYVLKAKAWQTV